MKKSVFLLVCLLLSSAGLGQNPQQHSRANSTVEVIAPDHVYAATAKSLRHLDFRNFRFHIFNEDGKPELTARLRNGTYERKWTEQNGADSLGLNWVRFVGHDAEFAIVSLSWVASYGSSSDSGVVQVLTLRDEHPVVVQQILFNTRGCGALSTIEHSSSGSYYQKRSRLGALLPKDPRRYRVPLG